MPSKLTIKEMQKIALERGGKCLSETYINSETKLKWQCSKGHIWEASPHNIKGGTWCPICNLNPKRKIEEINSIANNKGGKCLTTEILNVYSKIRLQCSKGHIWQTTASALLHNNTWCPYCSGKAKKTIEEMKDIAQSRGGQCLSNVYINVDTKLKWQCGEGHIWEATPRNVINSNTWCPVCAGSIKSTIAEMQKIAESRGGNVLSKVYKDGASHLIWQCGEGHIWKATPNNVKRGTWCPKCNNNISENICRTILSSIFNKSFKKKKPKWLVSPSGHKMELDGYNIELNIGFEYQGEQHYRFSHYWHKTKANYENLKQRDIQKELLCNEQKVTLIKIPYTIQKDNLYDFIISALKKHSINIPNHEAINYKTLDIYSKRMIEKMNEVAIERGGRCLSIFYIDAYTKLKWQCSEGHIWKAHPHSILNSNSWCPYCYGKVKLTLEQMKKIAESKGGRCLSNTYINSETKLKWQCSEGHIWEAAPQHIKYSNSWCPECAKTNKRLTIADMKKVAESRGGTCLSQQMIDLNTKLKWQCSEGHTWKAKPIHIKYRNQWCPECAKINKRLTITDMIEIAVQRGGKCLSDIYVNSNTKLKWQCSRGHIWEAKPIHVKNMNSWCPICANAERNKERRSNIEEMKRIATSRGGKCLSEVYVNSKTKLKWQCSRGHIWEAIPKQISRGTWCPICSRKKMT